MKKNTIKAFTLVEMLIVIVIIGILIASLMPRMQTAQGRARDVARKNDLSQIQTAIITSQSDRGSWPGTNNNKWKTTDATPVETDQANAWLLIKQIAQNLLDAGMSSIPTDPNGSNDNYWIWSSKVTANVAANFWEYLYMVWTRNWVADAGFVLMAKTEVEWSSNWVVCEGQSAKNKLTDKKWYIDSSDDLADLQLCKTVTQAPSTCTASDTDACCVANVENCIYRETWELRYIMAY